MKQDVVASLRAAVVALLAFTILCGIGYPLLVLGLGQAMFPHQANGSLVADHGRVVGSELIGQPFTHPGYFWSRPSAVGPVPYNAMTSSGTNAGPTDGHGKPNPALHDAVAARIAALRAADPGNTAPVPVDLVTASASGLDPHISPAAAYYQAARVARVRGLPLGEVRALVETHTEGRTFGLLGEPRVEVVALNRALDARTGPPR
ncbi:MAG TPA: potassium-transporting ATPase subunit KdpC [Kofleriaceae bacterium]|nr:potassium-transporting ATPase subunit KdpC [Kofleriaceae bacterium]